MLVWIVKIERERERERQSLRVPRRLCGKRCCDASQTISIGQRRINGEGHENDNSLVCMHHLVSLVFLSQGSIWGPTESLSFLPAFDFERV